MSLAGQLDRRQRGAGRIALFALVSVLAATAFGQQPAATQPSSAAADYLRIVQTLSDEPMAGRGVGTGGIERARDYLVEQFRQAGLAPVAGDSFLQPFSMKVGVQVEQELVLLEGTGQPATQPDAGRDFAAFGFSGSGAFAGPVVFVGYGIVDARHSYDSFAGLAKDALAGKIAATFRYEPQDKAGKSLWSRGESPLTGPWTQAASLSGKAKSAAERGAAALLVVNPPSYDRPENSLRSATETELGARQKIPVIHISGDVFRRMLSAAGHADAQAAARQLQEKADAGQPAAAELAGLTVRGQVKLQARQGTEHNVVGWLAGSGRLADQVIVVGAHYDHLGQSSRKRPDGKPLFYAGADDNASGTAGVVMLARRLAERAGREATPVDRRSVLFAAFSGEERGLHGSGHLAGSLPALPRSQAAGQCVAMVSLDMIGRMRNNRLYVYGVESGDRWRAIVDEAAKDTGLDVRASGGGSGPSDHASFYARKVPVLFFITGGHGDVHQASDTADKINAAGAVAALGLIESVIEKLRTDSERVAYVPPKTPTTRPAAARGGAMLGVVPDPSAVDGQDGCPVMSVMEGGPADKAGLREDDVIVRWNDKPISNVRELLTAVAAAKSGETVRLQVRRDDKLIQIDVTLGRR